MSLPTPAPAPSPAPTHPAPAGRGRLALAQSRTARHLRLDLAGVEGPRGGSTGILAPVSPWGVDPAWGEPAPAARPADLPLSDLVDRAAAQVVILRRVVDDAAVADRTVRSHASDLAQRLQQGQRFAAEFDARLAQAGRAAGMLEKVSGAITTLQAVVEQIRGSHEALGRAWRARLDAQRQETDRRLAELERSASDRLADLERRFDERLGALSARAEECLTLGEERVGRARSEAEARAEAEAARVDRHAAQAQARVSLILDGASDRLATMEAHAERLGGETADAVDALCARAALLLGADPRRPQAPPAEPPAGSLAHAVTRAEALVREADETGVRVNAMRTAADAAVDRLAGACAQAERAVAERVPAIDGLRESIAAAAAEAARARDALAEAVRGQAEAAARATESSALLARQREDLGVIAEATRYHVEQARGAETTLASTIAEAGGRADALRRAMDDVTQQAAAMVDLARKVARLVEAARPAAEGGAAAAA